MHNDDTAGQMDPARQRLDAAARAVADALCHDEPVRDFDRKVALAAIRAWEATAPAPLALGERATGPLIDHDWTQLEMAASGCTAGIERWPALRAAIQKVVAQRAALAAVSDAQAATLRGAIGTMSRGTFWPTLEQCRAGLAETMRVAE